MSRFYDLVEANKQRHHEEKMKRYEERRFKIIIGALVTVATAVIARKRSQ